MVNLDRTASSPFTDREADELVSGWDVMSKHKRMRYLRQMAEEACLDTWMELHQDAGEAVSR
jgi:hypothetical protein